MSTGSNRKARGLRRTAVLLVLTTPALALLAIALVVWGAAPSPPRVAVARDAGWLDVFTSGGTYTLALIGTIFAGVSLLLAVTGGSVWLLFRDWARRKLVEGAKAEFDDHIRTQQRQISHLSGAHALNEAALAHWDTYQRASAAATRATDPAQRTARADAAGDALDAAITLGNKAFELVYPDTSMGPSTISNLLPDSYEQQFAARVASNLSYYLVTRGSDSDIAAAAQRSGLVGGLVDACRKADVPLWRDIQESHIWVCYRTGRWDAARVGTALRALRESPDKPRRWETRYREAGLTV